MSQRVKHLPTKLFGGAKPDTTTKMDHPIHMQAPDQTITAVSQAHQAKRADMKIETVAMILGAAAVALFIYKRFG